MNIWIRLSEVCKGVVDITLDQIREGLKEPTLETTEDFFNTQEPLEATSVTEVLCDLLDDIKDTHVMEPDIEPTQVERTEPSETLTDPVLSTEEVSQQKHTNRSVKSHDTTDTRRDSKSSENTKARPRKAKLELVGVSINGKYESI